MKRILITSLLVQSVFAAQVPTLKQTLHNYVHSTQWASVHESYQQRMADIDRSFLGLFPTYKFSGMFGSEYRKAGQAAATRLKTKNVSLNITESFQFGKDYFTWKAREQDRLNENIGFSDQKLEVLMAGTLLHLKGFLMNEKIKILDKRKSISDRNRAQVGIKYQQGLMSFSEKEKTLEKMDELTLEKYQVEGAFYEALGQYEAETGLIISGFKKPDLSSWDKYLPKSEKSFIHKASQLDTTVLVANHQQKSAQLEVMASESQLYPKVDLQANSIQEVGYSGADAKNSIENVSITVSHDLFGSGNDLYQLKMAKSKARLARVSYLQTKRNLTDSLHNQWAKYVISQKTYAYAQRKMSRMKGVIRYDQKQFEAGQLDIRGLLDSEQKLAESEQNMIDAELKYRQEQMLILSAIHQLDHALAVGTGEEYE